MSFSAREMEGNDENNDDEEDSEPELTNLNWLTEMHKNQSGITWPNSVNLMLDDDGANQNDEVLSISTGFNERKIKSKPLLTAGSNKDQFQQADCSKNGFNEDTSKILSATIPKIKRPTPAQRYQIFVDKVKRYEIFVAKFFGFFHFVTLFIISEIWLITVKQRKIFKQMFPRSHHLTTQI